LLPPTGFLGFNSVAQLAVSAAGAAIGFYLGGPVGAQIGWAAGSVAGSLLFPEQVDVPKVGDLKAPAVQYGSPLVRLYGSNRTAGALAWYSPKRVIPGDSGGKGSTSSPTADTAEIDLLYILAVDSDVIAVTRVWRNGELIWTGRADSGGDSISASGNTDAWTSIEFLDGNASQLPPAVIEATEGVGNVPAYRHRQCVLIDSLQLGQSGQIPLLEFECVTSAEVGDGVLESFDTWPTGWTLSGSVWMLVDGGIAGPAIQVVGGAVTAFASEAWRVANVSAFSTWSFKVRLDALPSGSNCDDAPFLEVRDSGGGRAFIFSAAREHFYDTLQRPHMAVLGGSFEAVGNQLPLGVWFDVACSIVSGVVGVTITNSTTGDLFSTATLSGTYPATLESATLWLFDSWSYGGSDVKPTGSYDEIRLGDPGITPSTIDLADIVRAEWALVDDVANIDAIDLEGIPVRGFQASSSIRNALEMLSAVFHFGAVCSDLLYFRLRGGAIVATIDADDLAAGEGSPADEPFAPVTANDDEIPERVTLTYPNISDDYANGSETGYRGSGGTIVLAQQTNVVLTPSEAKIAAETYVAQLGISATTGQIALTDYYAEIEPSDPIFVPDQDGTLYRMRIARDTYGGGVHELELVRDDVSALVGIGITADDYAESLTVAAPAITEIVLLDTPILRDDDDDPGFYAAAKGSDSGSNLYSSADGVTYSLEVEFSSQAVFGTCSNTLGDWASGRVFDEASTLTVSVGDGELSSVTRASLLLDETINACAIGVDGRWELCQFRDATLVSTGVYTLTGFLRGARGTEWASVNHVADESFVLLTKSALRRVAVQTSEVGSELQYKGVSVGRLLSTAVAEAFIDNAVGQKCYAPVAVRIARDAATNDATITWTRRSRKSTRFASPAGIAAPLGEASEAYQIEVYADDTFAAVVRTISATNASASYSAAQQTADGLTLGNPISLRVYQINEIIGRGYAAEVTA
jgi:hypothetical protein